MISAILQFSMFIIFEILFRWLSIVIDLLSIDFFISSINMKAKVKVIWPLVNLLSSDVFSLQITFSTSILHPHSKAMAMGAA
jgi:hypothetical protein